MDIPLSTIEVAYSIVHHDFSDLDLTPTQELDPILEPIWAQGSLANTNSLDLVFPLDEVIIEALTGPDIPWDDLHYISYFLLELRRIEASEFVLTMTGDRSCPINPLDTNTVYTEDNMESITETIPIDISRTPSIAENVFVGANFSLEENEIYTDLFKEFCDVFSCSYEEMPGIDPRIIKHEITTYPDANLVRWKLHLVNPQTTKNIKVEVEKLLKAGFIYPV
jgi:hypothetical protein